MATRKRRKKYNRIDTSNKYWYRAKSAVDIIPKPPNRIESKILLKYVCDTYVTQGDLAGKRFGEVMLPWQERIIRWLPHVDEVAIKMGKGSGKSFAVAAIALGLSEMWTAERSHQRGLIVIVAANIESAKIVFGHIHEAIMYDPWSAQRWHPNVSSRSLTNLESGIVIQVIPPKLNRAIGLRPCLVVLDELHEAAEIKGFDDVIRQLVLGSRNWEDAKWVTITTAPPGYGAGYYIDWLNKARAVRDGKVKNNRFLPALFEFPVLQRKDIFFEDQKYWYFGMPSLQKTRRSKGTMLAKTMRQELEDSLNSVDVAGTGDYQSLLSQRLGIEMEERQGKGVTPLALHWKGGILDQKIETEAHQIIATCDPSEGLEDPFAVCLLHDYGDVIVAESRQWVTHMAYKEAIPRLQRVYDKAIESEELKLYETDREIQDDVIDFLKGIVGYPIFGGDAAGLVGWPERFAQQIGQYIPVPQGWQLHAAYREACGAIHAGRLKSYRAPLLEQNVKNLRVEGNRLLKAGATTSSNVSAGKIDGVMALISAIYIRETNLTVDISAMVG